MLKKLLILSILFVSFHISKADNVNEHSLSLLVDMQIPATVKHQNVKRYSQSDAIYLAVKASLTGLAGMFVGHAAHKGIMGLHENAKEFSPLLRVLAAILMCKAGLSYKDHIKNFWQQDSSSVGEILSDAFFVGAGAGVALSPVTA